MGSGISSRKNLLVVTTLNQSLLRDDVTISVENKKSVVLTGEKEFKNIDWVFQDGIGYIFTAPSKFILKIIRRQDPGIG
jgi:chondroitin AC lyase